MSMPDITDEIFLGDDDELDYDLEKDEEEALLADPDNYDTDENEEHYEEQNKGQVEETEDVLDIDASVALDETEQEDISSSNAHVKQESFDHEERYQQIQTKVEPEDYPSDTETGEKERNRFVSERHNVPVRSSNNFIPDSLDNVSVNTLHQNQKNNNRGRFNIRGRGRGRGNHNRGFHENHGNRGSVFNRVGNEGKTVLINPHFRGNVHVHNAARLVWDPNTQQNVPVQQMFPGRQNEQFAPNQAPIWHNPPPNIQYNSPMHHNQQMGYQEPMPIQNFDNMGRPFQNPGFNHPNPGNFRGREVQFISNQPPPLMQQQPLAQQPPYMSQPPPNQYQQPPNFNQMPPMVQRNYPPQNMHQNYGPNYQNNQYVPKQEPYNQNFNQYQQYDNQPQVIHQQNQPYPQNQPNNYNNQNNYQTVYAHKPSTIENAYHNVLVKNDVNRGGQGQQNFGNLQRSPIKRRSFDNSQINDSPGKKKKRNMEIGNLHEVPIVDMPDSTNKDEKSPEYEDEETKAYRKKIEEQKRLRERILQQKEERRKLTAQLNENNAQTTSDNFKEIVKQAATIKIETVTKPQKIINTRNQVKQIKTEEAIKSANKVIPLNRQIKNVAQQKTAPTNVNRQNMNQGIVQNIPKNINQRMPQQNPAPKNINQNIIQRNVAPRPMPQKVVQKAPQRNVNPQQNQTPNIVITQKNEFVNQPRRIVLHTTPQPQKSNPNRRVVLKASDLNQPKPQSNEAIGSFLMNRKVVETTTLATGTVGNMLIQGTLIKTPVVTVGNLAATTTDKKIRQLCQGLGPIQNIQMKPNSREATIQFKNIVSAHKFFKKYQRKIIDLSMIQVNLEPQT